LESVGNVLVVEPLVTRDASGSTFIICSSFVSRWTWPLASAAYFWWP